MQRKVQAALRDTGIPSYFISKRHALSFPSIVYTIEESSMANSCDLEEEVGYEIFINLYSKDTLIDDKERVKNALSREDNFYRVSVGVPAYDEDLDCYVQPFQYRSFINSP